LSIVYTPAATRRYEAHGRLLSDGTPITVIIAGVQTDAHLCARNLKQLPMTPVGAPLGSRLSARAIAKGSAPNCRANDRMIPASRAAMDVSLNQWMGLTTPKLVQAHLNLDTQTMAALRKDKPILVASLR